MIYDESFIDFSGNDNNFSLINSSVSQKCNNIIVIKSISKCYGAPMLRLAVAASGNSSFIKSLKNYLSIWNVNSFAEYFLQIIGKYKKDYAAACNKICSEQDAFYNELSAIEYYRVLPSRSNYFLCEITKKYTCTDIAKLLFDKYNILIKDCLGKTGFNDKYIKIAVRNNEDNSLINKKLSQL